jgi:dolichyl-phosphate beta-glucosyltransferase
MDQVPFLSVVIPAFNEEGRIGPTLARLEAYLKSRPWTSEVIVVDDGSTDGTAAVAGESLRSSSAGRLIVLPKNLGKGAAVRRGVLEAGGRLVLFTDADLSTPIEEVEKLLPWIEQGFDIVIGSRALPGCDIQVRQKRLREWMGKTFNLLVRLFVIRGIPDTQCGFKLFRSEAARDVFSRVRARGFGFDVEALYIARRLGLAVRQVPVIWCNSPESKVRLIGGSAGMVRDILLVRVRHQRTRRVKGAT